MDNKEKKYFDETTEFHILKKKGKNKKTVIEEDDDDFHDLESTREFRVIDSNVDVIKRYKPDITKGLTFDQVEERRKAGLVNKPKHKYEKSYLKIIVKNVFTYLNVLLFAVFAMLLIAHSSRITNYFFMGIITLNLLIGIIQEIKAKKIVDKLSLVAATSSKVLREGIETDVDAESLVLDDIVLLSTGNKIVSDSVIKEGTVEVNESLLTGESLPVKKTIGDILFAGSFVSAGSCTCQVERVGSQNYITCLQEKAKKEKKNNSVILRALNWIIGVDAILVVPLGLFNFISKYYGWLGNAPHSFNSALELAASSMIAMIPTGLYLTTSVALVVSVINLARRKTLVQDTYSIEMLARTDVLCLDKTGTITDGTMEVSEEISINKINVEPNDIIGDLLDSFKEKNMTAVALLNAHAPKGIYKAIKTLPFSSSRKMSAAEFENVGTFVVGAPEFMLDKQDPDLAKLQKYTEQGYRVLLLGKCDSIEDDAIKGYVKPLHAYVIKDHIRPEAHDTLKWFADNGVDIKIISGDNVLTVSAIAAQAGVQNADNYISLEGLTLEQVADAANKYTIFGRVAPEQKATLVTALKKAGHTVAMTGDGVNDILALKKADCSIAMASGSEAARNVSSLVLIESNFACLPKVVEEGRRVINNITQVASLFLMKTIFAIILTISTKYPFEPSHLMCLEVFGIGLPSFFLALQPNNRQIKGGFIKNVLTKALPGGLVYAIGILVLYALVKNNAFGLCPTAGLNADEANKLISLHIGTLGGFYISIMGIITLLFHCVPFNKFRVAVYSSMSVLAMLLCFVPLAKSLTGYEMSVMSSTHWIVLAVGVVVGSAIFAALALLFTKVFKTKEHD